MSFFLGGNLILLLLCACFGFLTRKLPENFNEAWYIFVSVSSTAFLWLVFLPTYFTTFYAVHQAALLATCLILNATITLCCLFLPKIYSIFYMDESNMKFLTMSTATHPDTGDNWPYITGVDIMTCKQTCFALLPTLPTGQWWPRRWGHREYFSESSSAHDLLNRPNTLHYDFWDSFY